MRDGLGFLGGDAERRFPRISGLNRDILAFVGDAKEGRLRRGKDWEICSRGASPLLDKARSDNVGDVRLRLGEGSSIFQSRKNDNQLGLCH